MFLNFVVALGVVAQPARPAAANDPGSPLALVVHQAAVRQEARVTDDQVRQLAELFRRLEQNPRQEPAVLADFNQLLRKDQRDRLHEVSVQVQGGWALSSNWVAERLELPADLRATLGRRVNVAREAIHEDMRGVEFRDDEYERQYVIRKQREYGERLLAELTPAQRKRFDQLAGPRFDVRPLIGRP